MASRSKNKTTFAKLARESRLRERRMEKQARKEARKRAVDDPAPQPLDDHLGQDAADDHLGQDAADDLASPANRA